MSRTGTLYFLCGKMAAGKSTLAKALAERNEAVLLEQDRFLSALFPGLVVDVPTYIEYSGRINAAVGPLVADMLRRGVSVVLDFPANTRRQRAWFRQLLDETGAAHELHFVDASDELCKRQLRGRSAGRDGERWTSEAEFELITKYFQAPEPGEGFTVVRHERRAG